MEMPEIKGKIRWVNIDVADNGFILKWESYEKKPGSSDLDHCCGVSKTHLFPSDKQDEAFDMFVRLKKLEMGMGPEMNEQKEDQY